MENQGSDALFKQVVPEGHLDLPSRVCSGGARCDGCKAQGVAGAGLKGGAQGRAAVRRPNSGGGPDRGVTSSFSLGNTY